VSISRKSFIGKILGLEAPEDRLFGSLSATSVAVFNGANMVRTHDVAPTLQAVRMAEKIRNFQE
jgi:dihydropteroate synthase